MAAKTSPAMLETMEAYERQELEEWLEMHKRYPTADAFLRAAVEAAFPGATKRKQKS